MKKATLLMVLVTGIDLLTAWPFQGPVLQALDVLVGLGLLAVLLWPPKARPPGYFGVGERVQLANGYPADIAEAAHQGPVYGTVLGLNQNGHLLRVKFDDYHSERHMTPSSLAKVSLYFASVVAPPADEAAQLRASATWINERSKVDARD